MPMSASSSNAWIMHEIKTADLGDKRLDKRLGNVLEMLSRKPQESITVKSNNWAEVKAAYRFFDNDGVTMDNVLAPHYSATLERIKSEAVVLLPQDTTELDYSSKKAKTGIGKLHYENHLGVFLHPVIAVTPARVCLGVVDANMFIREELGKDKQYQLPLEQKESVRWLEGYQVAQQIALQASGTKIISIADRECDIYEVLAEAGAISGQKADWIIRSSKDRCLKDKDKLRKKLYDSDELGIIEFDIPSTHKRKARHVVQQIKAVSVTLRHPYRRPNIDETYTINLISENLPANSVVLENGLLKFFDGEVFYAADLTNLNKHQKGRLNKVNLEIGQPIDVDTVASLFDAPIFAKKIEPAPVTINAVLASEINAPDGVQPVEWILLTSLPITTVAECIQIIEYYLCRWQIEVFFKVLKAGCVVEELQLQAMGRLSVCIALYMIISWRILFMTMLGRSCPDIPCTAVFADEEWKAAYIIVYRKKPPETAPSLNDVIVMIAGCGGFLKRKCDGFPGSESIWIGLQRVRDFAIGIEAQNALNN